MKRNLLAALFIIFPFAALFAQATKSLTSARQVWLGFFNQTRLSNRFGLWLDLQLGTKEDFTDNLSQILLRPGISYYVSDNTKLTAGYAQLW